MVLQLGRFVRRAACAVLPLVAAAFLGALLPASHAVAEEIPPPKLVAPDINEVDLIGGGFSIKSFNNSIGPAGSGLSNVKTYRPGGLPYATLNAYIQIGDDGTYFFTTLVLDDRSQTFRGAAGYGTTPLDDASGSFSAVIGNSITYRSPDGRLVTFDWAKHNMGEEGLATGYIRRIDYPTGETITFTRTVNAFTRNLKVESNFGYVLMGDPEAQNLYAGNLTQGNCDALDCAPQIQRFASQTALGRDPTISGVAGSITYATASGDGQRTYVASSQNLFGGDETLRVTSVTRGGSTWTYSYAFTQTSVFPEAMDGILTVTARDPNNVRRIVKSRLSNGHVISDQEGVTDTDTVGRTTLYGYTSDAGSSRGPGYGKLAKITTPNGDWFEYTIGAYNNITRRAHYPAGWTSGGGYTEMTAGYSCHAVSSLGTNICTQPDWIRDERQKQTDFTYDPTHGGVQTVTKPAGPNGVQPQTRYFYTQVQANYVKDGAMVGYPIWRLQSTSACRTQAACAGTADELVTEYVYQSGSSFAHNARLISMTTRAGNAVAGSSEHATTTYAYNLRGDVIETDGPLAGNVDLVQTRYDASRWELGTVGPDPDGGGSLLYRASKTVYRADGQVQTAYSGVVADRADATFDNSFQVKSSVGVEYDGHARPVAQISANGSGAIYALTQTNYDSLGRVDCTVTRMNASQFSSRPNACTPGTAGSDGPDRIVKTTYDVYGQVLAVQSGVGVDPIYERRATYTNTGKLATERDAENNLTTYNYDILDRLWRVYYPSATQGSASSNTGDYEEYGYDSGGNLISKQRRGGASITYGYDDLNRLATKTLAATPATAAATHNYGYDNFGNMTAAAVVGGQSITREFDALSRLKAENGPLGQVAYAYDAASRRTTMTWPEGVALAYEYDNANALTHIRRASTVLAQFAYDDLGRRISIARLGATTSYGYDAALRLSSLGHDLSGSADDVTFGLLYNAAGQIRQRTINNSAYVWNGAYMVDRAYAANGLNQMTLAGGASLQWSARGNLQYDGVVNYKYDLENRLRGVVTTGAELAYDPLDRLYQTTTAAGVVTRYLYDGANIIAEYNGSNALLRRYVFGQGSDELLARFDGSTLTPKNLMTDVQGSIIAATNINGDVLIDGAGKKEINTYDEYGIPGAGNKGLFQYTGQVWLADLGLYHYKARSYSPTLGRFLQTDPTGYDDGLNWYAYVGNDPLNRSDPTGLERCIKCSVWENTGAMGMNSGGRAGPATSKQERADLKAGNVDAYWDSRCGRGDPIGCLGREYTVTREAEGLARFSRGDLMRALQEKNGFLAPTCVMGICSGGRGADGEAVMRDYVSIRQGLANAHMRSIDHDANHNLSAVQVAKYHWSVFKAHGVAPTVFGGTPVFATGSMANFTNLMTNWCSGCDAR